jgi:hypothetical protein
MSEQEKYKPVYLRSSKIKELLVEPKTGTKLRISGEAVGDLYKVLEQALRDKVAEIIDALPRFQKGEKKGELRQITIKKEHLESLSKNATKCCCENKDETTPNETSEDDE